MIRGIEKLPERIKQHILDTVRQEFTPPDDRIWVTEILYCLRKAWFRRKMPKPIDLHSAWHLYRGIVFHNIWEGLCKLPLADARGFTPRGRGHVYDARCIEGRCLNAYMGNLHGNKYERDI